MEKNVDKEMEYCILCGKETDIPRDKDISLRDCYMEGAGQLCRACYFELYGNGSEKKK